MVLLINESKPAPISPENLDTNKDETVVTIPDNPPNESVKVVIPLVKVVKPSVQAFNA